MQQACHIFKKDIRYLYREIASLLVLAAISGWMARGGTHGGDADDALAVLYAVAAAFAISRLVHAEAIPGENQFWITRPYRWTSLLTAKVMFVVAFVHLPVLLMQAVVLLLGGFPFGVIVGGLLWTQVLILLAISLPTFALSALTPGLVALVAAVLGLVVIGFVVGELRFRSSYAPESIEWVRYSIALITIAIAFAPVLYIQYKDRRTRLAELFAGSVALCGVTAFLSLSWTSLFHVQTLLTRQSIPLQIAQVPNPPMERRTLFSMPHFPYEVPVSVHLRMTGVPDDIRPQVELYNVQLLTGGLRTPLNSSRLGLSRDRSNPNEWTFNGFITPAQPVRNRNATLHISFYVTLFGNKRTRTIPFQRAPVNTLDGLRCNDDYFDEIVCRAPFRWPGSLVSVKYPWGGTTAFTHLISYSPFPANLQLGPVAERSAGPHWSKDKNSNREVTIEIEEPVAYLRRDIEVTNFVLGER